MGHLKQTAVAIKLDPIMRDRIKRLADARQRSSKWMIREAIAEFIDREEKREAFRQDALRAWQEYQETGLHVTAEDADGWLAKLADGVDAELPTSVV
jgi:predicted transcriptional regulator